MKLKRVISIGLFALVLAVWGSILYRVITGLEPEETTEAAGYTESTMPSSSAAVRYQYVEDVRDPFEPTRLALITAPRDTATYRKKKEPVVIQPPPFKLSGILCNKTRHVATLEAPDGAIFFLSEKDTLDGIQILKIEPQQVLYVYRSQKMFWRIE